MSKILNQLLLELAGATPAPTTAPAAGAPAAGGAAPPKKLGPSAQKVQTRLAKIPGIESLLTQVVQKNDAAVILAAMATKLGGEKVKATDALTAALRVARQDEKEDKKQEAAAGAAGATPAPATQPVAGAAPATQPVATAPKESLVESVEDLVNYLFETTQYRR